jgi:hypothetical protein
VRASVRASRLQRIDFALQVYYLLNRGYPESLRLLVTSHLLKPEAITDSTGAEYVYRVVPGGYELSSAAAVEPEREVGSLALRLIVHPSYCKFVG